MQAKLPVALNDRSLVLDALRGFALLGIIIANTAPFSGYVFISEEIKQGFFTHDSDQWVDFIAVTLVGGKFYSLFSLLFGIGFSILLLRKGNNSISLFYRRLLVLAIIGLAHAFLLWDGDILLLYALLGGLLPLFRNLGNKALLIWSAALILSPILIDLVRISLDWNPGAGLQRLATEADRQMGITEVHSYLFSPTAGYGEVLNWNYAGFFYRWASLLESNRLPKVLGIFILGFYVGRNLLYARLQEKKKLLKKLQLWGFAVGLPFSMATTYCLFNNINVISSNLGILETISYALGIVPLSIAYTASFCLLWLKPVWKDRLMVLAPAGRMALTNYLMQSLTCIFIYYNVGLGLGITFGSTLFVPLAMTVFAIQVVYSTLWMKHFNFGPVEWIWRQLVYWKRLPLRKIKTAEITSSNMQGPVPLNGAQAEVSLTTNMN